MSLADGLIHFYFQTNSTKLSLYCKIDVNAKELQKFEALQCLLLQFERATGRLFLEFQLMGEGLLEKAVLPSRHTTSFQRL